MWYKRYGYKQPSGNGAGRAPIISIALAMIVLGVFLCALTRSFLPVIVVVPLTIYFFHVAEGYALLKGARLRERRKRYHINNASKFYKLEKHTDALESIRRAKIYGELPKHLVHIEESINRRQSA